MPIDYDFSGLTQEQEALLTFQGWTLGSAYPPNQPAGGAVRKLVDRGLLIPRPRTVSGTFGTMNVTEYEVPIPVHASWCLYCSQRNGEAA